MAITKDQIVSLNYELKIDGELVESNLDASSIEFPYGHGEIIPGLESRIAHLNEGDRETIHVPVAEAYGEYDEELNETLPIADFEGIDLQIGMVLEGEGENGELMRATVTEVTKESVTVDYNHPLAGKDLEFLVVIQKIA